MFLYFVTAIGSEKTIEEWGLLGMKNVDDTFHTTPAYDRQTDRQTNKHMDGQTENANLAMGIACALMNECGGATTTTCSHDDLCCRCCVR